MESVIVPDLVMDFLATAAAVLAVVVICLIVYSVRAKQAKRRLSRAANESHPERRNGRQSSGRTKKRK